MAGGNVQSYLSYFNEYGWGGDSPAQQEGGDTPGFVLADYLVFTATLVIALGIGVYQAFTGDKQRTTKEYLMGNRSLSVDPVALSNFMSVISAILVHDPSAEMSLSVAPVALSTFMSVISGILVLGTSAEMYLYGTQLWMDSVGKSFTYAISAHLFVPLMYKLRIISVFKFHKLRFLSDGLKMLCVVLQMVASLMYMGLAMYAPSTALEAVTGFPVWASLVCVGVVAVIYTTIGGIKAVVYTDFFQAFVLFGGLIAILIAACIKVGGLDEVWAISEANGRIDFFIMNPDPTLRTSFWAVMIGSSLLGLAQSGYEQTQIQRYCSLPTEKKAKLSVILQIPLLLAVFALVCLTGLAMFAYYEKIGCDPLRAGYIENSNQLLPYFMVDVLNAPGFPGLFVAVLFSGALSSVSSSMNSLAAITWKDIVEPRVHGVSEGGRAFITKGLAFGFGTIGVILGFLLQNLRGHVMQISSAILGGLYGPCSAVVFAGAILPWIHATGMTVGLLTGIFFVTVINVGQLITYPHRSHLDTNVDNCTFPANTTAVPIQEDPEDIFWLFQISYLYIGFVGFTTTILVGLLVSFITGKNDPGEVDPRTMIDMGDRCCCCMQEEKQQKCWCGIHFDQVDHNQQEDDDVKDVPEMEEIDRKADLSGDDSTEKQKTDPSLGKNGHINYSTADVDAKVTKENGVVNRAYDSDFNEMTQF